jgi:hypothetical protein
MNLLRLPQYSRFYPRFHSSPNEVSHVHPVAFTKAPRPRQSADPRQPSQAVKIDVDAYLDRLAGKDILTEWEFKPLKPGSIPTRARQLHEFVSALVHRGHNPQSLLSLHDVATAAAIKQGLGFYIDRPEGKALKQAHDMAYLMAGVARHWSRVLPDNLAELKKICRRLDRGREADDTCRFYPAACVPLPNQRQDNFPSRDPPIELLRPSGSVRERPVWICRRG